MRDGSASGESGLTWLFTDHLGSSSTAVQWNGTTSTYAITAEMRYKPFGEQRYTSATPPTDLRFTGQRLENGLDGIYDFKAQFFDPAIGRFLAPDSIIPNPGNPLAWDRYIYSRNNPIRYTDPSGHDVWDTISDFASGFIAETLRSNYGFIPQVQEALNANPAESTATLAGRVVGDVVNIGLGVAGFSAGLGIATGGTIASCVGTACVAAVATIGVGGAAMAAGAGIAINGGINLGQNLALMSRRGSKGLSLQNKAAYADTDVLSKGFHLNSGEGTEITIKPSLLDSKDPTKGIKLDLNYFGGGGGVLNQTERQSVINFLYSNQADVISRLQVIIDAEAWMGWTDRAIEARMLIDALQSGSPLQ